MASVTATAPHNGPVDQPGEGAYLWARAGIARSGTTRANYVPPNATVTWIVRDSATGAIIATHDVTGLILMHTLQITQALNDEPDTCSFTLRPQEPPAFVPAVGDDIRIAWASGPAAGVTLFYGFVITELRDWRVGGLQPPWISVQCQDPMWRFDARMVTYQFPSQSVTASIQWLVDYFCNDPRVPTYALNFSTAFVAAGMPSIPAFAVVNQRPSTVMRTLTAAVGGGFYIEGLTVHAWAGTVSEPNQTDPTPLTVGLASLHSFRMTEDASQLRRRVLVEGRRTSTLIALPTVSQNESQFLGMPIDDATLFDAALGPDYYHLVRVGTQWMYARNPVSVRPAGKNPPQGKVQYAYVPGGMYLQVAPVAVAPPPQGWIRVGNQYSRYAGITGNPVTEVFTLQLPAPTYTYGVFTVPIAVGDTVEWVDSVMSIAPHGLIWDAGIGQTEGENDLIRAQPTNTPVVTLAVAQVTPPSSSRPQLEGFVQDGRYSYAGAQARATADVNAFRDPLPMCEWVTDDRNALPGREQVINLSHSDTVNPPVQLTVTILRVELSFPLRTLPPRRTCTGGLVKPSTFLDLVVTTTD